MALSVCLYYKGGIQYDSLMDKPIPFILSAIDIAEQFNQEQERAVERARAKATPRRR